MTVAPNQSSEPNVQKRKVEHIPSQDEHVQTKEKSSFGRQLKGLQKKITKKMKSLSSNQSEKKEDKLPEVSQSKQEGQKEREVPSGIVLKSQSQLEKARSEEETQPLSSPASVPELEAVPFTEPKKELKENIAITHQAPPIHDTKKQSIEVDIDSPRQIQMQQSITPSDIGVEIQRQSPTLAQTKLEETKDEVVFPTNTATETYEEKEQIWAPSPTILPAVDTPEEEETVDSIEHVTRQGVVKAMKAKVSKSNIPQQASTVSLEDVKMSSSTVQPEISNLKSKEASITKVESIAKAEDSTEVTHAVQEIAPSFKKVAEAASSLDRKVIPMTQKQDIMGAVCGKENDEIKLEKAVTGKQAEDIFSISVQSKVQPQGSISTEDQQRPESLRAPVVSVPKRGEEIQPQQVEGFRKEKTQLHSTQALVEDIRLTATQRQEQASETSPVLKRNDYLKRDKVQSTTQPESVQQATQEEDVVGITASAKVMEVARKLTTTKEAKSEATAMVVQPEESPVQPRKDDQQHIQRKAQQSMSQPQLEIVSQDEQTFESTHAVTQKKNKRKTSSKKVTRVNEAVNVEHEVTSSKTEDLSSNTKSITKTPTTTLTTLPAVKAPEQDIMQPEESKPAKIPNQVPETEKRKLIQVIKETNVTPITEEAPHVEQSKRTKSRPKVSKEAGSQVALEQIHAKSQEVEDNLQTQVKSRKAVLRQEAIEGQMMQRQEAIDSHTIMRQEAVDEPIVPKVTQDEKMDQDLKASASCKQEVFQAKDDRNIYERNTSSTTTDLKTQITDLTNVAVEITEVTKACYR